MKINNL